MPKDKIISRYHRTMAQLPEALSIAYHAYLWDNSKHGSAQLFCELKRTVDGTSWNIDPALVPIWFLPCLLVEQPEGGNLAEVYRKVMERFRDPSGE